MLEGPAMDGQTLKLISLLGPFVSQEKSFD
jgi:hypothetical protein